MGLSFFLSCRVDYVGKSGAARFADGCFSPCRVLMHGRVYEVLKTGEMHEKTFPRWKNVALALALIIPAFILGLMPKLFTYFSSAESKHRKIVLDCIRKNDKLSVENKIPSQIVPQVAPPIVLQVVPPAPPPVSQPLTKREQAIAVFKNPKAYENNPEAVKNAVKEEQSIRSLLLIDGNLITPHYDADSLAIVSKGLEGMPKIQSINLDRDPIMLNSRQVRDLKGIQHLADNLPEEIGELSLHNVQLDNEALIILARGLARCRYLGRLDLSKNNFGIEGLRALRDAFRGNIRIDSICLSDMNLGVAECAVVAEILKESTNPISLSLIQCGIDDQRLSMFTSALLENQIFQSTAKIGSWSLSLADNPVSVEGIGRLYNRNITAQNKLRVEVHSRYITPKDRDLLEVHYLYHHDVHLQNQRNVPLNPILLRPIGAA